MIGPVKIGGDKKAGQALENNLFDGVALSLDAARSSCMERPVVIRQTAQYLEDFLAHHLLPAFRVGHRANLGDGVLPRLKFLLCDLVHPSEKRVIGRLLHTLVLPSAKAVFRRPLNAKRRESKKGGNEH
ncbi:MAG: hypothetical protein DMG45_22050 [Acidobacteria bacterium]|nr:MAG: hypothetical protein DMG45_22050 [Acidobacteriota bacterium]